MDLHIRPFEPRDQQAVRRLILSGMEERWGFLDPAKNPDLNDIARTYRDAVFLTAWIEEEGQGDMTLVGTGVLLREDDVSARVVRMSVARSMRRCGIGTRLLRHLCASARALGYRQVVLETTSTWDDAIAFYEAYGFRRIGSWGGDTHFVMTLKNLPTGSFDVTM